MSDTRQGGGALWRAYEALVMVLGLGTLAILCLLWLPVAMLLHLLLARRIGQVVGRRCISSGLRVYLRILGLLNFRFDLAELDALRDQRPLIVAANHPSLLDAVMILSRLPDAVCVIKASLMDNVLFGAAARLARYIRNDEPLKMILDARDELARGAQLVIFPEGTRTVNFPVDACLSSVGLISGRSAVPVQTLLIEFSSPYLGKAWPLFRRPELPLHCRIRLGARLDPPRNVAAFTRELEANFRRELSRPHPDAGDAGAPA